VLAGQGKGGQDRSYLIDGDHGAVGVGLDQLATQLLERGIHFVLAVPAHLGAEFGVASGHGCSLE